MEADQGVVLAIEAAVRGGSIALLKNGRAVAASHGHGGVSRAEELLQNISEIFEQTQINKRSVDFIAVSNGPGSYTGIRIGLATALGLARALDVQCIGVPLLEAIADFHGGHVPLIAAVPMGRGDVCWQVFRSDRPNSFAAPASGSIDEFYAFLLGHDDIEAFLHQDLFEALQSQAGADVDRLKVTNVGLDLAVAIGSGSCDRISQMSPNYVRTVRVASDPT